MPKIASPLPYHGGKSGIAGWIVSKMPDVEIYIEPYFGGGSVLLARPYDDRASEIVNDIDGRLTNFWKVLQSESLFPKLIRLLDATPISEVEWVEAASNMYSNDPVKSAAAFFMRANLSRGGVVDTTTFRRLRKAVQRSSCWLNAIDKLPDVYMRLRRVMIYQEDAIGLIKREDARHTFFYLDPPYKHSTRPELGEYKYKYECDDRHHLNLIRTLGAMKGLFLLSGYDSKMYSDAAAHYHWNKYELEVNKASSTNKFRRYDRAVECLWCNY